MPKIARGFGGRREAAEGLGRGAREPEAGGAGAERVYLRVDSIRHFAQGLERAAQEGGRHLLRSAFEAWHRRCLCRRIRDLEEGHEALSTDGHKQRAAVQRAAERDVASERWGYRA